MVCLDIFLFYLFQVVREGERERDSCNEICVSMFLFGYPNINIDTDFHWNRGVGWLVGCV